MRTLSNDILNDFARARTQLEPLAGREDQADDVLRRLSPGENLALLGAVTGFRTALEEMRQVRARLADRLDGAEAALAALSKREQLLPGSAAFGELVRQVQTAEIDRDAVRDDLREIDRHLSPASKEMLVRATAALRRAIPSALRGEAERARRNIADEIRKLRSQAGLILRPADEYAALAQHARSVLGVEFETPTIDASRDLWSQVACCPEPTVSDG